MTVNYSVFYRCLLYYGLFVQLGATKACKQNARGTPNCFIHLIHCL